MNFMISLSYVLARKEVHHFPGVVTFHSRAITIAVTIVMFWLPCGKGSNPFPLDVIVGLLCYISHLSPWYVTKILT